MLDFFEAERRYLHDPEFRTLVDYMVASIERLQFSAGDLKAAAIFAAVQFEMRHPRPVLLGLAGLDPETKAALLKIAQEDRRRG